MANAFEIEVISTLEFQGFKIINKNPKYVDLIAEKDNKKIAIEIKSEKNLTLLLPKAFGQLMASKYIYNVDEQWLIIKPTKIYDSNYFKVIKEAGIRFFTLENKNLTEIRNFSQTKRNRKVRRGIDYKKIAKIWKVLAESEDWLHIAEISRRTKIHEATVRWYLDHYLSKAVEEEKIGPKIKLRLIKLKPNIDFQAFIKALKFINEVKIGQNTGKE